MGRVHEDLTGRRVHRLVVVSYVGGGYWSCRCDCSRMTKQSSWSLKKRWVKSCGCYRREWATDAATTHGGRRTVEYSAWCSMIGRCYNKRNPKYADYGGRGIRVCKAWRTDFAAFLAHVGKRPSVRLSLDRIRVNGNYEPGNVRWATPVVQSNNRRVVKLLKLNGVSGTIAWWAERTGLSKNRIWQRINVEGFSVERALTQPLRGS